jgi:hypothetical protein
MVFCRVGFFMDQYRRKSQLPGTFRWKSFLIHSNNICGRVYGMHKKSITVYPQYNGLTGGRGRPILPNVHKIVSA